MVVDALAKSSNVNFIDGRYGFTASLSVKGRQLLLLKPSTYMNLSGNAALLDAKENIPLKNVLIVVDDLALPFGTLRLKGKGSDAGHNGLKHIATTLGTENYARLRFGIGNDFPMVDKWIMYWEISQMKIEGNGRKVEKTLEKLLKVSSGRYQYHHESI